jgi:hypothetical protein
VAVSRWIPPLLLAAGLFIAAWIAPAAPASFAEAMRGPAVLALAIVLAGWQLPLRARPRRLRRIGALGFALVVLAGGALVAWLNPAGSAAAVVTFGAAAIVVVLPSATASQPRCARTPAQHGEG